MNDLKTVLSIIVKKSKEKKKISCFFIGNTKKKEERDYYITPVRENERFIFSSCIVFNDSLAKNIAKILDGNIDYILVDAEKKIDSKHKFSGLSNIERSVKDSVKKSKLRVYKANDLSVLSAETLVNNYFLKDKKGIGGKKALIIGLGNIGFKISLKLVEGGATVFLFRRNQDKLLNLKNAINNIKPSATVSKALILKKAPRNFKNYDIIIGSSDQPNIIDYNQVKGVGKKTLLIDIGKGNFSQEATRYLIQNKINIFRLDVTSSYFSYLDNLIYTEIIYDKKNYIFKKNTINFVSQGVVGQKNDIIVDDVNNPKLIYGICDGKGNFIQKNNFQRSQEIKKIYKLTGFKLIYE
jgi:fructose-specific phosphotransferase system component IIB